LNDLSFVGSEVGVADFFLFSIAGDFEVGIASLVTGWAVIGRVVERINVFHGFWNAKIEGGVPAYCSDIVFQMGFVFSV